MMTLLDPIRQDQTFQSAESIHGPSPVDLWVRRELRRRYRDTLTDHLPDELTLLVERFPPDRGA